MEKIFVIDKYYFYKNKSNARFINHIHLKKKRETQRNKKDINLKLGHSNLLLMYYSLMLLGREGKQKRSVFFYFMFFYL